MKYLLLIPFVTFTVAYYSLRTVDLRLQNNSISQWDSTKNWRIYKIQNLKRIVGISRDSLKFVTNVPLNNDSVHAFLSRSTKLPMVSPAWMGCYLTSFEEPSGQVRKVIVSQYAGFFYSEAQNSYFEIEASSQQEWLNFLSDNYVKIP